MVRIPNPLDALGALAAIPASLGITALLKLTDPGASTLYGLAERGSGVRAAASRCGQGRLA